ncbi:hypothetical protein pb186bvf_017191 [Paramecium bursaria]
MDPHYLGERGIILEEKIGEGSFGQVFRGTYRGENVAIKILNQQHFQETNIMENLSHPNIIKLRKYLKFGTYHYVIMELAEGHLQQVMGKMDEIQCSQIMKSMLLGLQYLHEEGIVHRDIKPDNILIKDMNDLTSVKIADFGLSFQSENGYHLSKKCGTMIYMAPEQIQNLPYGKQVDIWSCGVVLYMLLSGGKHPFYPKIKSWDEYINALPDLPIKSLKSCSILAQDLIKRLLCVDKNERYTVLQALSHPWITRRFQDQIPVSIKDFIEYTKNKENIIQRFKMIMMFAAISKNSKKQSTEDSIDISFENKDAEPNEDIPPLKLEKLQAQTTPFIKSPKRIPPMRAKSYKNMDQFRSSQLNLLLNQINPIQFQTPKSKIVLQNLKPIHTLDQLPILESRDYELNTQSVNRESIYKDTEGSITMSPQIKNRIILPALNTDSTQPSMSPIKVTQRPQLRKSQSSLFVGLQRAQEEPSDRQQTLQERQRQMSIEKRDMGKDQSKIQFLLNLLRAQLQTQSFKIRKLIFY